MTTRDRCHPRRRSSTARPARRSGRCRCPTTVRGALVQADEQEMFAGLDVGGQGPAQVDPRRGVPAARARARRGVRRGDGVARSTSTRCGRRSSSRCPTFGFLKRLGRESVWGKRHDQPYHVIGCDAVGCRAARRLRGAQLEAGRRGHGALQLTSTTRTRRRTTTRCWPRTSASGASRPTSAASPRSRS